MSVLIGDLKWLDYFKQCSEAATSLLLSSHLCHPHPVIFAGQNKWISTDKYIKLWSPLKVLLFHFFFKLNIILKQGTVEITIETLLMYVAYSHMIRIQIQFQFVFNQQIYKWHVCTHSIPPTWGTITVFLYFFSPSTH